MCIRDRSPSDFGPGHRALLRIDPIRRNHNWLKSLSFFFSQTLRENIAAALARASSHREYLYSFDMLGEGARSAADAERYLESYAEAIAAIGRRAGNDALPKRPGISVKLS